MNPSQLQFFLMVMVVVWQAALTEGEVLKIGITHWNDVSGQMEPFVTGSGNSSAAPRPCSYSEEGTCVGGVVNLVHHIHEPFGTDMDARLRLSSGNLVGGESGWVPSFGWERYNAFIRDHFKPDVLALGMKEFGNGVEAATELIDTFNFDGKNGSVVLANSCGYPEDYNQPELQFCQKIARIKKILVMAGCCVGYPIGVIGFVTPTVERLSLPGRLEFHDVPAAVQATIADNSELKTFIAIGDGSLEMAKRIIDTSPEVKLVIFGEGFSNTPNMTEEGEYPLRYKNSFVATAGRYGSSVGKLLLSWDTSTGNVEVEPESKLVVTTRPEMLNMEAEQAMRVFNINILTAIYQVKSEVLGVSRVPLEGGGKCWREECNLGNLLTDAMVHCALSQPTSFRGPFPHPVHSVWHAGGLFEETAGANVNISRFDIFRWLPYYNKVHLVSVSGGDLRRLFEESAKGLDPVGEGVRDWRQFLQVSRGMEVHYEVGSSGGTPKLGRIRMTVDDMDGIPRKEDMQYFLVIPTFLFEGRGVYGFARDIWSPVFYPGLDSPFPVADDCLADYVTALRSISIGFEERIWIDGESGSTDPSTVATTEELPSDPPSNGTLSTEDLPSDAPSTGALSTDDPSSSLSTEDSPVRDGTTTGTTSSSDDDDDSPAPSSTPTESEDETTISGGSGAAASSLVGGLATTFSTILLSIIVR